MGRCKIGNYKIAPYRSCSTGKNMDSGSHLVPEQNGVKREFLLLFSETFMSVASILTNSVLSIGWFRARGPHSPQHPTGRLTDTGSNTCRWIGSMAQVRANTFPSRGNGLVSQCVTGVPPRELSGTAIMTAMSDASRDVLNDIKPSEAPRRDASDKWRRNLFSQTKNVPGTMRHMQKWS